MKRLTIHVASLSLVGQALCYSPAAKANHKIHSRRKAFSILCSPAITSCASIFVPVAYAKDDTTLIDADVSLIREATEALDSLLDNWDKATVDCTYADVPRDLLEAKNKEKLLEKASEFALFDKSASVVSCKKTNRIVRDYIGATGKGPLVGAEKRLLKRNVVDLVDSDSLDEYFSAVETFSQLLPRATALAYSAGHNDFDSMNNFAKGEESGEGSKILDATKEVIVEANVQLKKALSLLTES